MLYNQWYNYSYISISRHPSVLARKINPFLRDIANANPPDKHNRHNGNGEYHKRNAEVIIGKGW